MALGTRKREYGGSSMDVAGALDHFEQKMAFTTGPVELNRAIENGVLVGVGALKHLDPSHAEIKSMHTAEAARRRGIGRAMVEHLVAVARARRYRRVSLETGSAPVFAPARALYASAGFAPCGPFSDYRLSPNSAYMTLELDPAPEPAQSR